MPTIPVVTPAAFLRDQLADARRRGEVFEQAWPDALRAALEAAPNEWERDAWSTVFADAEMISTWRSAFDRQPASAPEHALVALTDPDRVPLPERPCEHCGEEIPPERGRYGPAKFCSDECRQQSHSAAARERVVAV